MNDYQSPDELFVRTGKALLLPLDSDALWDLDAVRLDLARTVADWHKLLAESKNRMLHPKDKEMTELDRNVMLDAHVAVIRRDYEFLVKLETLVEQRIDLIRFLLTIAK